MTYTKLTIKINSNDKPPYFIGSQLRGAFGYALKNVVQKEDLDKTLYDEFFLDKNTTHPYRFDIRLGLSSYEFSFYLFDKVCDEVFNIITTIHEMLTSVGLGKENKTYQNFDIYLNDKKVFENGMLNSIEKYTKKFKVKNSKSEIIIRFDTPLRIKKHNRFVRDSSIELYDILNSIHQRKEAILGNPPSKLDFNPSFETKSKNLYFKELTRRSNLQDTTMQFGGIMGEMWIGDLDEKSYQLLKLGELIGVGKQTVFGLGKISIGAVK